MPIVTDFTNVEFTSYEELSIKGRFINNNLPCSYYPNARQCLPARKREGVGGLCRFARPFVRPGSRCAPAQPLTREVAMLHTNDIRMTAYPTDRDSAQRDGGGHNHTDSPSLGAKANFPTPPPPPAKTQPLPEFEASFLMAW